MRLRKVVCLLIVEDFIKGELFPICSITPPDPIKILSKAFDKALNPGSTTSVVCLLHD